MALTATATTSSVQEIKTVLCSDMNPRGEVTFKATFLRSNIRLEVRAKMQPATQSYVDLGELVASYTQREQCGMVYVPRIADTSELVDVLAAFKVKSASYHAKMDAPIKEETLLAWQSGV